MSSAAVSTPSPFRRLMAGLALAAVLGAGGAVAAVEHGAAPAGKAGAMAPQCWYHGWFKEGGVWYYGYFREAC